MSRSARSWLHGTAALALAGALLAFPPAPVQARVHDLPDFTGLVQQSAPAVVNISTHQLRKLPKLQLPKGLNVPDLPKDSPLYDFFRRFFGEQGDAPEQFDAQSLGSGFIISSDGYVLTNKHVIDNADEIVVRLSDRREFVAKVVGADERSDIALLHINAKHLPVAKLGIGYKLKVGEWVLAIGSPFGFDHSATAGIVSAMGRSLPHENYVPFIQTDVAINPGNSGGPLYNLDGQVVGVNSQIYSRTGGFMGLSFAIPIDVAMNVAEQLKSKGKVTRGWLGVLIQDVTRELAESFGMQRPQGALVARVLPGSPAAKAGVRVGDIVLAYDGDPVEQSSDLPPLVGRTRVGAEVPLKVLRKGRTLTLKVVTAALPDEEHVRLAVAKPAESGTTLSTRLGLGVADLTTDQREQLKVPEDGVLVTEVRDGPAQRAGVQKGDVILMLDNEKVADLASFKRLVARLPMDKAVSMLVQRRGSPIFLALKGGQ